MTDGTFTMKIDPDTERQLIEVAKETDRSKSAVIRTLIRAEHKRIIAVKHADGTTETLDNIARAPITSDSAATGAGDVSTKGE